MRNVWKGLFFGAVTGAAIGLVLDLGQRLGRGAAELAGAAGQAVREHAPEVRDAVVSVAARGVEQVKDADLPGKARDLATHLANTARAKIDDLPGIGT